MIEHVYDDNMREEVSVGASREDFDEIAGHLNAQHGRLVDAAAWVLENELEWSGQGMTRPERFLAWRFAVGVHTGSKALLIAGRRHDLPECVQALRDGLLSFDQMTVIARHAPGWADRQVLNLCERLTVDQIQRLLPRYPWPVDPGAPTDDAEATTDSSERRDDAAVGSAGGHADGGDVVNGGHGSTGGDAVTVGDSVVAGDSSRSADDVPEPIDRVRFGRTENGRWFLHADLTLDAGLVVEQALNEARDHLFSAGDVDADSADALAEIAHRSLGSIGSPSRRDRFRVNIHLDTDATPVDALGRVLPDAVTRHLTCDGSFTPTFLEGGHPVSVGRRQHIVPDRTRRLVVLRDGGCVVPGCGHTGHLEVHHVVHWSDGGPTDTANLVCVCPKHHRLHHQGQLGIVGDADRGTLSFTNRHGQPIRPSGARPRPPGAPPPPTPIPFRPPLGERLNSDWVSFSHPSRLRFPVRRRRPTPSTPPTP